MNAEKALFRTKEEIQLVSSQSESGKHREVLRAREL